MSVTTEDWIVATRFSAMTSEVCEYNLLVPTECKTHHSEWLGFPKHCELAHMLCIDGRYSVFPVDRGYEIGEYKDHRTFRTAMSHMIKLASRQPPCSCNEDNGGY